MNNIHRKIITFMFIILLLGNSMGIMAQEYGELEELTPEHLQEKEAFEAALTLDKPSITPFWLYANDVSPSLSIKSGVATCTYDILAKTTASQINTYVYLQRLNSSFLFENVTSWSKKHYTFLAAAEFKYTLTKLGTYRHKLCAYIYNQGTSYESITVYSNNKTY